MTAKEIGSEFWSVPQAKQNALLPEETQWFASGRSALKAILQENRFKTAALPAWCCDSMILPFLEEGIKVEFYQNELPKADVALVLEHFGFSSELDTACFHGIIIRDLTHSLFSARKEDADYYFGSLRKWAGFYTGGFAWGFKNPVSYEAEATELLQLRDRAMEWKARYIQGKTEDKGYLSLFSEAEELLEHIGVAPAAERDIDLAKHLDASFIVARRRENAQLLLDAFSDIAIFPKMGENDCPLFVPILVPDGKRNALRAHLIENKIYCPVHWPVSEYHSLTKEQTRLYENELSLVCDQGYGAEDMQRMIDVIDSFFRGKLC